MSNEHIEGKNIQEDNILEINLQELLAKIIKHHRLILNSILACLALALLYSFIMRPVYKSTARIMIEGRAPKITKVDNAVFTDYDDRANYFNSQIEVLKSHAIANLAYDELGGYEPWGKLRGRFEFRKEFTKTEKINSLLKNISINPVRMTQIIEIIARDINPQTAAKIVNAWVASYIVFSSMDELIQRRTELESEIEQNLKYVKEKHPIIQGLRSEIAVIDAQIKGEKQKKFNANVKVIDDGQVPEKPYQPRILLNLIIALFIGAFGGVGIALLLENMDQSIQLQADIESFLHLPCLATVPTYKKEDADFSYALASAKDSTSMFAERFRSLRTSIIYSNPDLSKKVILITSAGPSEGKTTVAVNLATTFAQGDEKVILLDADLRKPVLHSNFNASSDKGLTDLLARENMDFKPYINKTGINNLDLISCGTIPINPAELLGSKKMELLLKELSKNYDRIILDSPPVLAATDAVILSTKADAAILVFKAGVTHKQSAIRSAKLIHSVHAKILGAVLNMAEAQDHQYYQYYNYRLPQEKTA